MSSSAVELNQIIQRLNMFSFETVFVFPTTCLTPQHYDLPARMEANAAIRKDRTTDGPDVCLATCPATT